jgi:uncharacterized protein YbjT (DUF2867 family)
MSIEGRTALLAGATGLVGGHLLTRLLASPEYARVIAVTRKRLAVEHPKLHQIVTDFDELEAAVASSGVNVDDAFCALGTTIKIAGSQEKFRRVDFDYVAGFARAAKAAGAKRFLLVSAMGASARSTIFYSRVKGEAEDAVSAPGFAALHIFRPGMLLGARAQPRPIEVIVGALTPLLNPLMMGGAAVYKSIRGEMVAEAMVAAALGASEGRNIHTYRSMAALAKSNS